MKFENGSSEHLDIVQDFRLWLENISLDEQDEALDNLRTPANGSDMSLRQELEEWRHMIEMVL